MSLFSDLEKASTTALAELEKLAGFAVKARQIWVAFSSPQTRAVMVKVSADFLTMIADGTVAVTEKGANFTMDIKVYNDAKQLITDALADGVIKTDLALLGIKL